MEEKKTSGVKIFFGIIVVLIGAFLIFGGIDSGVDNFLSNNTTNKSKNTNINKNNTKTIELKLID